MQVSIVNRDLGDLNNLGTGTLDRIAPAGTTAWTVSELVGAVLGVLYPIAVIILTVMLVWGGIEIMLGGSSSKSAGAENGKKRIMAAVIGFLITAGSYMIMILIETILGISIVR